MNSTPFTLPSYAKVNLFLKILGKRTDNFHELYTAFQTISLHDKLTFQESDSLCLTCDDENIPTDESNLILKSAMLLLKEFDVKKGATIHLNKNIPFPAGLGGGSSNAAIALLGLSKLWELDISFEKLCEIASNIGSDVPFFLYGGTAIGKGRGTEVFPIEDFEKNYMMVVTPDIDISTADAYRKINAEDLTNIAPKSILKICREADKTLTSKDLKFVNDFEKSVFELEPRINQLKDLLLDLGAKESLLSGSGASVFAIFDNEKEQKFALSNFDNEANVRRFAVKTISRTDYLESLGSCKSLLPRSF